MEITQVPRKKPKFSPLVLWRLVRRARAWTVTGILILFMQFSTLAAVGQTPVGGASYRFVQLKNGETIEAQVVAGDHRSPDVVSRFAGDVVTLGYKWDTSKRYVEDNKVLFPASYAAVGNLFSKEAQLKWGVNFATKYGKNQGGSQQLQNSYALLTGDPIIEDKGKGLWFAEVRAVRFITDGKGKIFDQEKLRVKFALKAINPNPKSFWGLANKDLAPYMERFWSDGLAVVDFVDMRGYS